jgi:DNA invertase Pin-like site-specific DNA recombinase
MKTTKSAFSYLRYSTPDQALGDSERRQLALAKDYCGGRGLNLSEQKFADRGVSGFHGKHRENGTLGELLKILKPGNWLLVEDCDRWSREDPIDALSKLRDTVCRGVSIVILRTGVTEDNFNDPAVLYPNFFGAALDNAESVKKAERVQASWDNRKRQAQSGKSVRQTLPCWLLWPKEADKPVIDETKAPIVRRIFDIACSGSGLMAINRILQREKVTTIQRAKKHKAVWNVTSIRRILMDKATIGFYTLFLTNIKSRISGLSLIHWQQLVGRC